MWARARVDELMARDLQALQRGETPEATREEIVTLALAHRLMTQFTSFVAVENQIVNQGGQQRTVPVEVAMPDGVRYEGIFGEAPGAAKIAGAYNQLATAPMAGPSERAAGRFKREPSIGGALVRSSDSEDKARLLKDAPTSSTREEDGRRRDEPALDATVRAKLAPELVTLLGRPDIAARKLLTVRVRLTERAGSMRDQLEAAGLHLTHLKDRMVVGTIEPGRLAALAALDVVQRIALADE
jgi:hypothetical protein